MSRCCTPVQSNCMPLPLIPILYQEPPPPPIYVPIPCEFSCEGLVYAYNLLEPGQTEFTVSDLRRFRSALKAVGMLTDCSDGPICRPDLWVAALQRVINKGGNFRDIYIELLRRQLVIPR